MTDSELMRAHDGGVESSEGWAVHLLGPELMEYCNGAAACLVNVGYLPGYGYAAVARGAKLRWQQVMAEYLEVRRSLSGVVLMIDSRLGFTDLDRQLLEFVAPRVGNGSVKLLVLLTKADKLNRRESNEALAAAQAALGDMTTDEADVGVTLFSALNKTGIGDAALVLHGWTH